MKVKLNHWVRQLADSSLASALRQDTEPQIAAGGGTCCWLTKGEQDKIYFFLFHLVFCFFNQDYSQWVSESRFQKGSGADSTLMKRNVTPGLVQLFLHGRKIQTHSSIKSNRFLSCIKVISPNYRDETPLWHCLHSVMTSKGVWVSQGYSLPVWCYDSQVIVWVTSAFSLKTVSQEIRSAFCRQSKAQNSYPTTLLRGFDDTGPLSLVTLWLLRTWLMMLADRNIFGI